MARIVKHDLNVTRMEVAAIIRHYCVLLRRPFVNIGEGPKVKELLELAGLHYAGPLLAALEMQHPRLYRVIVRLRDSLAFRYRRYRALLLRGPGRRPR